MGQAASSTAAHERMYLNLLKIESPRTRAQMIQTILSSPEHCQAAKNAGVYGHLLHYAQVVQSGSGKLPVLPGERAGAGVGVGVAAGAGGGDPSRMQIVQSGSGASGLAKQQQASEKGNEKALNYFSACLRILELEEEVALTEEGLKGAYKKAVIRAHPDKGGSEKEFEAVTRAYAYLGDILRRIHGGRSKEGKVEAPGALSQGREREADAWKMVEPVRLNPSKLDVNAFNQMFEKTRIPDPEESGYGDWLKGGDDSGGGGAAAAPKFSGKFNRDVFHKVFQEENNSKRGAAAGLRPSGMAIVAQEQSLASRLGYATELGRTGRDDYTVAANDPGLKYTDLKKAYTEYNTFSHETAGVKVESRTLDTYSKEREKAPGPLTDYEALALREAEKQAAEAEKKRVIRMQQEAIDENNYFERMKRLVIRN